MHADRKHGNTETRKHGNTETRKHGNTETRKHGNRHQKFPSARGYGPFMVPSRCPCLAWRSLFSAVPFWSLLALGD
jgi:hypothetical protein